MLCVAALLLLAVATARCDDGVAADADIGQKVLVILDTLDMKRTHSLLFHDLAGARAPARAVVNARRRRGAPRARSAVVWRCVTQSGPVAAKQAKAST